MQETNIKSFTIGTKPDVAIESASHIKTELDWVGMTEVELPVLIQDQNKISRTLGAKANIFVNLIDPNAKGIHMSRLYLNACKTLTSQSLSFEVLDKLCLDLIESHTGLSDAAFIDLAFEYLTIRDALVSDKQGWRFYPIKVMAQLQNQKKLFGIELTVTYSSTCPCSAALARQLNTEEFMNDFGQRDLISVNAVKNWLLSPSSQKAVPHAQRSNAIVKLFFEDPSQAIEIIDLINLFEKALPTPVQAAVKREDEQEFARLNGNNMMFSEDACRRLKDIVSKNFSDAKYQIKVEHFESLHPHNATAYASNMESKPW